MFAIGNDELALKPYAGETAKCPKCKKEQPIIWGKDVNPDGTKTETRFLGAVKCCGKTYLVVVGGKLL